MSSLENLIEQIKRLPETPETQSRRIALCRQALTQVDQKSKPILWAQIHVESGLCLYEMSNADRARHLEEAIKHFEAARTVYTHQDHAELWAATTHNLANAYVHRIEGDRAENLEQAITLYHSALGGVWTPERYPFEWGEAQKSLGMAYLWRIQGERSGNLQKAIQCYQHALKVRTKDADPEAWAEAIHNIATAYSELFTAEDLEEAIRLYEQALEVRTRQAFPLAWARTQNGLGNAYARRIQGERVANLERAIEHYSQALQVQSLEKCPQDWAKTQQNLAVAYSERLLRDRADNLRKAIEHYEQASRAFNKEMLEQWATVRINLADTHWKLGNWERSKDRKKAAANLDRAVTRCLEVVGALDPLPRSSDWALAHYNLGNAYGDRINGDLGENQEWAIEHYTQALQFYASQTFPDRLASTHNNLAVTYWERQGGNRAENLLQAIHHFNRALEFFTPETSPVDARRAARNLGNLHFGERNWVEAHAAYDIALRAAGILYRASFMEVGRDVEIGENVALYIHDAFCLAHLGQIEEALVRLEEGKTRTLAERLGRDAAQLEKARYKDQKAYRELLDRLKALEAEQRAGGDSQPPAGAGRPYTEIARDVERTRKELNALTQRIRGYLPDFLPAPLNFVAIQALVPDERTALVEFCVTEKGSVVLVIQPEREPEAVWIEEFTEADLRRAVHDWVVAYHSGDHIQWQATIERVLNEIGLRLITPLHTVLQKYGMTRLTLIPQGSLFLLPLHAAPLGEDGACLLDRYEVSYAPSAAVLQRCQERATRAQGQGLFAVANPTGDLTYAESEVQAIASLFKEPRTILRAKDATKQETLAQASGHWYAHFSCHGRYDWDEPSRSALLLARSLEKYEKGQPGIKYEHALTLTEVEARLDLTQTRLVTLSACETGLSEAIGPRAEEYVGLPAGFLLAGAPAVVASLWAVNDLSTALLMERFYHNHLKENMSPAEALCEAQQWLRDLLLEKAADKLEEIRKALVERKDRRQFVVEAYRNKLREENKRKPFAHPYYWAAFTMNGV